MTGVMGAAISLLSGERLAADAFETLRWAPFTAIFVLLSSWWVKGPLFVAVGALSDLRRNRRFPFAALWTGVAVVAAGVIAGGLKSLIARGRPPDSESATTVPPDSSFPSGHTMSAFAAAVVVSAFFPRVRWLVFGLAFLVAVARLYLGVHFLLDVLAGAAVGVAIGFCAVWMARRTMRQLRRLTVRPLQPVPAVSRRSSPSTEPRRTPIS
jgi:undecaprenyl-diphosphatase